ncbi:hypothetical protein SD71_01105 [Cohnella kolymensis]|uniref:Xylose isomerase-like TIM barrel domain-containing protein n=1 Tax=Cohnella kolymensis TaxID=1590652 RepID=A0ABR5A8D2_9BACL|nr:sugar phosphate isomerase/epimerase family protein [Cohnella kolymensis]KIL37321.1 hypothetical protein SD71_01105 [Cohnella kolymensis]
MKTSICTSGFKEWSLEEVFDWVKPLELDGIELWMGHIERFQEEHGPLDKLKAKLQEYGLEVPAISGYTTFSGGFSGERDLQQEFKSLNHLLDVARQLNCPLIRTFVGHKSSRLASPEQWGQVVSDMMKVMSKADQYEINIAIEIHYDTFVDNTESLQDLVREVNHPRVKVVFDGANLNVERIDQMEALPTVYSLVEHVHLKNYKWDHDNFYKTIPVPVFDGDIDNRALLHELQKRNYKGYISVEYFGEKKEANILQSLKSLKELIK